MRPDPGAFVIRPRSPAPVRCTGLGSGAGRSLRRTLVRTARLTLGTVLIVAGVVSGFLPILQGWVFILAGLTVMAPESHYARRLLHWVKEKLAIHKKHGAADPVEPGHSAGSGTNSDSGASLPPAGRLHG